MNSAFFPAGRSGRCRAASGRQRTFRFPAFGKLLLALVLAGAALPALGSAAVAQNVTFSLKLSYVCSGGGAPGCDSITEQATFTTLQAPANGPIDLSKQNGGKGVLSSFWLIEKRDSANIVIACADGSALTLDTSKIFTQKNDYFSCGKVTIKGSGLNLVLSPVADGRGGVQGSMANGSVTGKFRFMARHIDTLISQEFITLPLDKIAIQNKWDSCSFTGMEVLIPSFPNGPQGCLLTPGANDNNPWTLKTFLVTNYRCHAVCMSRLPE
jgi:hypothetical protein